MKKIALLAACAALTATPVLADTAAELNIAQNHAGMAAKAADLKTTQMHLHHAVNCLVGPKDGDFDKTNTNPCAQLGNGAFPDESNQEIKTKLQNALSAAFDGIASNDEATAKKNAATVKTILEAIK